jgi:curved DNA-binding protein
MEYKDYYKILGVEKNADEKEIKKAYRKLARQYHPDMNPGDKAAEARFKEINEAHEVLSDPEKRRKYDDLGQDYQRWQQAAGAGGGQGGGFDWTQFYAQQAGQRGPGGARPGGVRVEYADINDLFGSDQGFSDFFQAFFGGGMSGAGGTAGASGTSRRAGARRAASQALPQDFEHEIEITLEEAFKGSQRLLDVDGRRLEVKIPAGVKSGSRIRMAGEGPAVAGGARGDIYLVVKVLPDPNFERRGDDLYTEIPVDLFTALLGGEARVPTLGGAVALKIKPGTQSGRTIRLAGQGMPKLRSAERGDLYAKVRVLLPEKLSEREEELVREWARLRGVSAD